MFNPGQSIRLRASARTNTGKVRDNNEDSVHLWARDDHVVLAIVADGMGGAVAGEEASRITIETIHEKLTNFTIQQPEHYDTMEQDTLIETLQVAIHKANLNIVDQANEQPQLKGMGTTVTLAFVRNSHAIIAHVGDSRAYLVDGSTEDITQITSDHSFVQALVAAGHISEEEAEEHPMRNVLYRALGQGREVEVDVYHEKLHVGDRLILCSDGLTLHVKPQEIAKLAMNDEPGESSQELIDLANARGGRDNVSVIVIKAEADPDAPMISGHETAISDNDYGGEGHLIIHESPGFGSSESLNSPQQEQRDGSPQGNTQSHRAHQPALPEQENIITEKVEPVYPNVPKHTTTQITLGEGHDLLTPDQ